MIKPGEIQKNMSSKQNADTKDWIVIFFLIN